MGKYEAGKISDTLWIVKRFHATTSSDDESDYDEAQVVITTDDPQKAIDAAIAQQSWN